MTKLQNDSKIREIRGAYFGRSKNGDDALATISSVIKPHFESHTSMKSTLIQSQNNVMLRYGSVECYHLIKAT